MKPCFSKNLGVHKYGYRADFTIELNEVQSQMFLLCVWLSFDRQRARDVKEKEEAAREEQTQM